MCDCEKSKSLSARNLGALSGCTNNFIYGIVTGVLGVYTFNYFLKGKLKLSPARKSRKR